MTKYFSWVTFALFFLFFLQNVENQAQNIEKNITFSWQSPHIYPISEDETVSFLSFEGAIDAHDYPTLPLYFERFPISTFFSNYEITLSNLQYQALTTEEIALLPTNFQETAFKVSVETVSDRKKPYVALSLLPLRKTGAGFEKLIAATVTIRPVATKTQPTRARSFAANSRLRSGQWYKIAVSKTGVHKVTYADLQQLGVAVSGLPSARIAIFGNGGAPLPEANASPRYDDLTELPIQVFDGGDGTFDADDYFIFYAESAHGWNYNTNNQRFIHNFNLYDRAAYYFICTDNGVGEKLRIQETDNSALPATTTVTTYTHYGFYEEDKCNIAGAGRSWFGDKYDATTTYSYTLSLPTAVAGVGRLTVAAAAAAVNYSSFNVTAAGNTLGSITIAPISGVDYAKTTTQDFSWTPAGGTNTLTITYNKPSVSSSGYFDYAEWQIPCHLRLESYQTPFCAPEVVTQGSAARYVVANMTSHDRVWDVTNLHAATQMAGVLTAGTFSFNARTDTLRKFVAFSDNQCYSVTPIGRVANQDLHGSSLVDMVVVAYPDFVSQAERLAEFRRTNDGLSVKVVTPQQIYNEFASGSQDVTAIRDYMKMIYEKTNGRQPQYLLLFGRPSYDYRNVVGDCKLYVPNYQSVSTLNEYSLRSNDDYFGILGDAAGEGSTGMVDVSVGRFPVSTVAQAKLAVDKTINYASRTILGANTPTSNFGSWKNIAAFVADDENGIIHVAAADAMATIAEEANPNINIEKIYLDAYQQVTYSSSARYPEVTAAINNRMNMGCLLFSYVGHGGKNGWATERVIELTDISGWTNRYNQPWMVTLTCEFGWYDRALVAPAEMAFLNANGGVAGMVTTARVAFTNSNETYGRHFFAHLFDRVGHLPMTIGEVNRMAKNLSGGAGDSKNMIYVMGDPAMRLAVPLYQVVTDSINGVSVTETIDTLRALAHVTISGHIEDNYGNFLPDFNGSLFPAIYDKKTREHTLQNDPDSYYFEFLNQKNILFKGNVSINNGRFRYSFILPKDINYMYGAGKMSYYAYSAGAEAAGAFHEAIVGGMSANPITDTKGPEIELFMNDENFVNGGIVNTSPVLIVKLKDEFGINTTGNGIGHDLVAIIDGKEQTILNAYYEAQRDSFNCGIVRYPYEKLSPGTHKVKVRAWDIINNASEQELEFVVTNDDPLTLSHVLNYPNPFTTSTSFFFEHNLPATELQILLTIYTISGKVVKTIETTQVTEGFRSQPILWDGHDDFGDKLGRGTYLYRLKVRTPDGRSAEKFEKIVIL